MSYFPSVFRRNNQNYQMFCETKIYLIYKHIFFSCLALHLYFFTCLADWLFSGYIICSLKSYLTSFTTVILTILKSIPVMDIFSPSLLPTLNSDIHPRNQSCVLKFWWIKSRTQKNPKFFFCYSIFSFGILVSNCTCIPTGLQQNLYWSLV